MVGIIEEVLRNMWVCLEKVKTPKRYLHNNQIIQNPFAPELALDVDSIMSGQKNIPILMWIIEEMKRNMYVRLAKEKNNNRHIYTTIKEYKICLHPKWT